jgi:hypothetical protein
LVKIGGWAPVHIDDPRPASPAPDKANRKKFGSPQANLFLSLELWRDYNAVNQGALPAAAGRRFSLRCDYLFSARKHPAAVREHR